MIVNDLGSIEIRTWIKHDGLKTLYVSCAQYHIGAMTQDIYPSSRVYSKWDLVRLKHKKFNEQVMDTLRAIVILLPDFFLLLIIGSNLSHS